MELNLPYAGTGTLLTLYNYSAIYKYLYIGVLVVPRRS